MASVGTNVQKRKVYVIGVGMTKFEKPGKKDWDYPDMAEQAAKRALADAGVDYKKVEQVAVGYVYGDSTAGQRAVYNVGLTGVPVYNVNNNCSTGSTALFLAKQLVEGGIAECVMALGFEKMERGSLGAKFTDRVNPLDRHMTTMINARGMTEAPPAPQMFGNAGREHMDKYGTTKEQFAKIAYKNHKHSVNNPYSQFRDEYTLEQVLKSPTVFDPLTKLQCCPTSDGAAAAILASEEFVRAHNLQGQAVEIAAMVMRTDFPTSFEQSCIKMVGSDMTRNAAETAYRQAGVLPKDIQVIELHDCFSCNELLTYEALGLCKEGEGGKLIDNGQVTYGGKWVVNPSGGLISKGHPLGATGLAQCAELCWQLRNMAGKRQVQGAKAALQHNVGLGGAVVVGVYRLGFPDQAKPYPANKKNYAIEADDEPAKACPASKEERAKAVQDKAAPPPSCPASKEAHEKAKASGATPPPECPASKEGHAKAVKSGATPPPSCPASKEGHAKAVKSGATPPPSCPASKEGQLKTVFDSIAKTVASKPNLVSTVGAVYQFDFPSDSWTVDLKTAPGKVSHGKAANADCKVAISESDFVGMMTGKLSAQKLFMEGKLKLTGKMELAMKLRELAQAPSKL